jgi:hypothetical protein
VIPPSMVILYSFVFNPMFFGFINSKDYLERIVKSVQDLIYVLSKVSI